jgi:uncharacterized protein (DUF1684 family)
MGSIGKVQRDGAGERLPTLDTGGHMTTTIDRLSGFRARRNEFFAQHDHSPLTPEQRSDFQGLAYYAPNDALRFELALETDGDGIGDEITIGTADGGTKTYVRAGRVRFDVEGEPVTLTVFKEPVRGRYFVPFRDGTAGTETYAVGRYLDPRALPDGRLSVDFNFAYNPYCAYSDGWSCPIPPAENVTKAPIRGGERSMESGVKSRE